MTANKKNPAVRRVIVASCCSSQMPKEGCAGNCPVIVTSSNACDWQSPAASVMCERANSRKCLDSVMCYRTLKHKAIGHMFITGSSDLLFSFNFLPNIFKLTWLLCNDASCSLCSIVINYLDEKRNPGSANIIVEYCGLAPHAFWTWGWRRDERLYCFSLCPRSGMELLYKQSIDDFKIEKNEIGLQHCSSFWTDSPVILPLLYLSFLRFSGPLCNGLFFIIAKKQREAY